ncbi:hypothetical protein VNO78_12404 [Psophocarpus tetragonolobus]|uniref:TIR domain-containing protein n=1 Tax=Psophocarpus tetragonolobus TaxID=3891 RepID=A0AAN9SMY3_PSOTE
MFTSVGEPSQKGSKESEVQAMESSESFMEKKEGGICDMMLDDTNREIIKEKIEKGVEESKFGTKDANGESSKEKSAHITQNIGDTSQGVSKESFIEQIGEAKRTVGKMEREEFGEKRVENLCILHRCKKLDWICCAAFGNFIMAEHPIINVIASSTNSSMLSSKKYDVFLSFRGEDTRMNFTSHLYEALRQKKVETYIDYQLEKGDEISSTLIKAIKDSHILIVILSENYASSKWCLEELSKILECQKNQGQIVIPVFYNTDPSHVRKQIGSYKKAFAKHKGEPRCNKWRASLTEVANLAGWDSRNRIESELLRDIVGDVLRKLTPKYPNELKGLVGIEENYEQIESFLKIGSNEVIILGIWGMGGIGKTALATAFFAKLSHEFDASCFLLNVSENSNRHGLQVLHHKLLSQLLENENHSFAAPSFVPNFAMRRLGHKKVFIVLDDVSTSEELEYLSKDYNLLGQGSRVIVTTRNKQIFRPFAQVYNVKELNFHHSLQLFCLTVFEEKQPQQGYEDLSRSTILYCKGIPLALKVLGASFRRKSKEGTEVVEGITLNLNKLTEDLYLKSNSFTKMTNMRFLKIHDDDDWQAEGFKVQLPYDLELLSNKLRYFHWDRFSLDSLPSNFCAEQLVKFHMHWSKIKKLWDGVQNLVNLKEIDLWGSKNLVEMPDLSKAENLERFCLSEYEISDDWGMRSIIAVNNSVGVQDNASNLSPFQAIFLNNGHFLCLKDLDLRETNVETLPANIKDLPLLIKLLLNGCWKLVSLPELPPSLEWLYIDDCYSLMSIPELPPLLNIMRACNCTSLETNFTQRLLRAIASGVRDFHNENELGSITQIIGVSVGGSNNENAWKPLLHVITSAV